jgi:hypothetical protein
MPSRCRVCPRWVLLRAGSRVSRREERGVWTRCGYRTLGTGPGQLLQYEPGGSGPGRSLSIKSRASREASGDRDMVTARDGHTLRSTAQTLY